MNNLPQLLLHICCAPCSTVAIDRLSRQYQVIGYFYNPNIFPEDEFHFRADECVRYMKRLGLECLVTPYDEDKWRYAIKGLEKEPEGRKRCKVCYAFRFKKTAQEARKRGIKFITTTLTISPHKNHEIINRIGSRIASEYGLSFIEENFKKQDGFRQSVEISNREKMYRQDYCGCEYSIRN